MKKYIKREFLCPISSQTDSYIISDISLDKTEYKKSKVTYHLTGELKIADCYRSVRLDFSAWEKKDLAKMRAKAKKTEKLLCEFFEKLEEGFQSYEEKLTK